MKDWQSTDDEIKTLTLEFNKWINENKSLINSQIDRNKSQEIYNFINPPQIPTEQVISTTKASSKKEVSVKKKQAYPTVSLSPKAELAKNEPRVISKPEIKPISIQAILPVIEEQPVRAEEKQKTKGQARADETALQQAAETDVSPKFLFSKANEYPIWISALIEHRHIKMRGCVPEFLKFLSENSFKGGVQHAGDKCVFSLLSPIDGKVYAETFHNPHKTVDEKSWPSWRYALYNLLVKGSIIDGGHKH